MSILLSLCCKRQITVSSVVLKSYYETLGVTPTATQADIKAAYYKLSMVYHPDRNQGSKVAAEKFQLITAAYEVIGNYDKRRAYDRGLLVERNPHYEDKKTKSESIFHRQRPTATGRTPIYDFDEWSRSHYGQSFARRAAAKDKYDQKVRAELRSRRDATFFWLLIVIAGFIISTIVISENSLDIYPNDKKERVKSENCEKNN